MKKEVFVNLETAKKLKDAGFDVEVIGSYDLASYGKFMRSGTLKKWNYNAHEYTISAPTLEEALEWLKSVHNIEIEVYSDGSENMQGIRTSYQGNPLWCTRVSEMNKPKGERFGIIWETYSSEEKAVEAGIYKACQIITNNFEIEV